MSSTISPWASTDHDPVSLVEKLAHQDATLTVRAANGTVIAQYPDFAPGAALRVLPAIVSSVFPITARVVDDGWSFVGATRHPEYATIRHDRDLVDMAIERHRLQHRP